MNFEDLLRRFGQEPIIPSAWFLTPGVNPALIHQSLGRWVKQGRLVQLRRGLYVFGDPYRKREPHPFHLANHLAEPSYVSLQSALAWHGLIPEGVPVVTSLTTGRPTRLATALGRFLYRHGKTSWFHGYQAIEIDGMSCLVARPEKALLDLIHLTPCGDEPGFLRELRLQEFSRLDFGRLMTLADESGSPKLRRAVPVIRALAAEEALTPA